jgi:CRISPR/Cas system-associated exonuclease Cas4 (RecB family)
VETVQYNIDLRDKRPEPIEKSPLMIATLSWMVYSPTALDTYLRCPLGFYHRYVLNLKERERSTGDIERADVGLFVHAVLAEYFRKNRMGRVLSEADFQPEGPDGMDAVVERRFKTEYGEEASGAAVIMKSQVKKHLRDFLVNHQAALAKNCELSVTAVEKSLSATVILDAPAENGVGLTLKGRIDRVERRGGKTYIIDYKTSSDPGHLKIDFLKLDPDDRSTWPGAIGTLQLPFYMMLYAGPKGAGYPGGRPHDAGVATPGTDIRDVNAAFILLGRSTFNEKAEIALFKEGEDADARFGAMKTVITGLLKEIINPDIPFYPTADGGATPGVNGGATPGVSTGDACRICSYRPLCGI